MEKTPALWLVESWRCVGVSSVRQMRWSAVLHNSALFQTHRDGALLYYVALNKLKFTWTETRIIVKVQPTCSWAEHLLCRCWIITSGVPVILSICYIDWFSTKVVLAKSFELSYFSSVNTALLSEMWIQLVSTSAPERRTFMWFQMFLSNYSDGKVSVCRKWSDNSATCCLLQCLFRSYPDGAPKSDFFFLFTKY